MASLLGVVVTEAEDAADEEDRGIVDCEETGGATEELGSLVNSPQLITVTVSTRTGSVGSFGVISITTTVPTSLTGIGSYGSPTTEST